MEKNHEVQIKSTTKRRLGWRGVVGGGGGGWLVGGGGGGGG